MNGRLEQELVAGCRNADNAAYTGLVKAHAGRVFAVCLGMLGNTDDAEDVAQQTLLKGLTDIDQLRDGEQFGAWICRIAKNLCVDFIRRQQRKRTALAQRYAPRARDSKEHPELQKALAELPEEYRLPLMLYYFNARSTKNIAETLEISRAAVHTRLSRARKQLRALLQREGDKS